MTSRRFCVRMLAIAALVGLWLHAQAEEPADYPSRPIRLTVTKPVGGLDDTVSRILQPHLQRVLGQPVIVENLPGADGIVGTQQLIRSELDRYRVLFLNTRQQVTAGALAPKPAYDLSKDLTPVVAFATFRTAVIAHPSVPGKDLAEVLQYAKAHPEKVVYATTGPGSVSHLVLAMAARQYVARILQVPYKGGGPGAIAVASGEAHLFYTDLNTGMNAVKMGKGVRIIGQSGNVRAKEVPDAPLFSEQGFGLFADNGSLGSPATGG